MVSTKAVHACPHCGGERLQKNGHTQRGAQRALCVECKRTFTLSPKGPRHGPKFKEQVLAACQDRLSLRGIQRTFGVCYLTVLRWLGGKPGSFRRAWTRCCPANAVTCWSLDELWSFVQSKGADALVVGGALSKNPPDRRLDAGRPQRTKRG